MKVIKLSFLRILILVFGVCGGVAFGQTTGTICGTVKDPSGAVMPNLAVVAVNTETGIRRTVTTDEQGFYVLTLLPVHLDSSIGADRLLVHKFQSKLNLPGSTSAADNTGLWSTDHAIWHLKVRRVC